MASLLSSVAVMVIRLQGRKRRWSAGARLVETARRHNERRPAPPPRKLRRRLSVTTDKSLGFAVHRLAPRTPATVGPTIVYLHGGGYIHDIAGPHWSYLLRLVQRTGATVLAVRYPLAPQHSWRDSFEQVVQLAHSADVVAGDSAGGGFALAVAQRLAAQGQKRSVILIAPLLDATLSDPHTAEYDARDPWLSADGILACGRAWAGGDDPALPEISPLFGPMADLGRVLLFSGTRDILHPQALALARWVEQVQLVIAPGCVHNYPILPLPEAREALDIVATFLDEDDPLQQHKAALD